MSEKHEETQKIISDFNLDMNPLNDVMNSISSFNSCTDSATISTTLQGRRIINLLNNHRYKMENYDMSLARNMEQTINQAEQSLERIAKHFY